MNNLEKFNYIKYTGIISIILGELSIWLSIIQLDTFDWKSLAISDLGVFEETALIFNSLNIIAGLLFLLFQIFLIRKLQLKLGEKSIFIVAGICSVLLGVFPKGDGLHSIIGVIYFVSTFITIILISKSIFDSQKVLSIFSISISTLGMILLIIFFQIFEGIAIGEYAFILSFQLWLIIFTIFFKDNNESRKISN